MKKYNLSAIMSRAWAIFRKGGMVFAEALHRASAERQSPPTERGSNCSSQSNRRDFRGLQNVG